MSRRAKSAIPGMRQSAPNDLYQAGKSAALASQLTRDGDLPNAVAQARVAYRYLARFLLDHGDAEDLKLDNEGD